MEFNYNLQQEEKESLAASGLAALSVGVRPSAAQQAAMGYTDAQINGALAAYQQKSASGRKGNSSSNQHSDIQPPQPPNVKTDPLGYLDYYRVNSMDEAEAILSLTYDEVYALVLADEYAKRYLTKSPEMREQERLQKQYGTSFTQALAWADRMLGTGKSNKEIEENLGQFDSASLNSHGVNAIMGFIREKSAGGA